MTTKSLKLRAEAAHKRPHSGLGSAQIITIAAQLKQATRAQYDGPETSDWLQHQVLRRARSVRVREQLPSRRHPARKCARDSQRLEKCKDSKHNGYNSLIRWPTLILTGKSLNESNTLFRNDERKQKRTQDFARVWREAFRGTFQQSRRHNYGQYFTLQSDFERD